MKKILTIAISLFMLGGMTFHSIAAHHEGGHDDHEVKVEHAKEGHDAISQEASAPQVSTHESTPDHVAHEAGDHPETPIWLVIPFVALLLMIATGPLFFEHFWHHNYPIVAVVLAVLVGGYYSIALSDVDSVIHAGAEYVQFIALLAGLFMASGGILIKVDKEGKPLTNVILLLIGAVLANLIGTTGASMLLVRPFIRLNKGRVKPYHIIFFIFMVSNVGGSLTPVGDPPLFLGFLKGVPFAWTITHNMVPWAFASLILGGIFYFIDSRNTAGSDEKLDYSGKISVQGGKNFLWIAVVIGAVFLDPNVFSWVPSLKMDLHGHLTKISFLREAIMLTVAGLSYKFSDEDALKGNEFEFEPIKEVAFIFIGIFFTMIPALAIVGDYAKSNPEMITLNVLYWGTGALSGVLDNAPTYVNFLTAAIASDGGSVSDMAQVAAYANGEGIFSGLEGASIIKLTAISVASVFFGAMTYIGNAPNFMVKSIAEQVGVPMPAFFAYVVKFSLPILLPVLFLVWLVFFELGLIEVFV
jgi:Na+/H+ antiporter NhaD/arsenite permease-like protein